MADGVFYAELNELLTRELAEHGYSGVEVRVTPIRTEIIIRATRTQNVLGELDYSNRSSRVDHEYLNLQVMLGVKGRRIRELTSVVQKRFKFPEGSVELYAEKVANRGLSAIAQAESLRYKLLGGLAVRRYCFSFHISYVHNITIGNCSVSSVLVSRLAEGILYSCRHSVHQFASQH